MSDSGTLIVRVYTSAAKIPVEGATVVVTARGEGGKERLVSVQITDRSGLIRPVSVAAPAPSESTSPNGGARPYAVLGVWAEHPGFAMLRVEGVQVFSGQVTEQGMELLPLGENENSLETRGLREIPGQNL